jgi:N-acetylneuraminic acid mutarotase
MRGGETAVYAFGGNIPTDGRPEEYTGAQAYDLSTDTWTELNVPPSDGFSHGFYPGSNGVGTIDGKLYIPGGYNLMYSDKIGVPAFYVYDPVNNSVTRKASMPKATWWGVSGVIHRKLYVLPGVCDGENWPSSTSCDDPFIRSLFRYDPATDAWEVLAPAPHNHQRAAAGIIKGKFYVAGGFSGESALDVYDPRTNSWTTLAPVPTPGEAFGAVVDDKLYVVIPPNTYAYDPRTNTWETKAPYSAPGPRCCAYRGQAMASITLRGRNYLLAMGGVHGLEDEYNYPFGVPNDSQLYEP